MVFLAVTWTDAPPAGLMFAAPVSVPQLSVVFGDLNPCELGDGYWVLFNDDAAESLTGALKARLADIERLPQWPLAAAFGQA